MLSVLRRAVAAAVLVGATAVTAEAQGLGLGGIKVEEVRVDLLRFETNDFGSDLTIAFPGRLALAMYINDKIAIEPIISLNNNAPDGADSQTNIAIGTLVPYYLGGDRGVSGLFIAPGFMMQKFGDADAVTSVGAEIGMKKKWQDKISWRIAASMFSTEGEMTIGVNAGVSLFVR